MLTLAIMARHHMNWHHWGRIDKFCMRVVYVITMLTYIMYTVLLFTT